MVGGDDGQGQVGEGLVEDAPHRLERLGAGDGQDDGDDRVRVAGAKNAVLPLMAATLLGEQVSPLRWAGTLSILVGILVVARGERGAGPGGAST